MSRPGSSVSSGSPLSVMGLLRRHDGTAASLAHPKFSPPGAGIWLQAGVDSGTFRMRVRDPGIGINEEDQRRLFTAFFRAGNRETRSVPGPGLGLYIAHSIVALHGGAIAVESASDAANIMPSHAVRPQLRNQ